MRGSGGGIQICILSPSFNGLGDRADWRECNPDILIIEGWFLGVKPLLLESISDEIFNPELTPHEISYRENIQKNLENYQNTWNIIDQMWQLKPLKFEYMNLWKSNQEKNMLISKGSALKDKKLDDFLRMLNVSIPNISFNNINPNVLLLINQNRKLLSVGLN